MQPTAVVVVFPVMVLFLVYNFKNNNRELGQAIMPPRQRSSSTRNSVVIEDMDTGDTATSSVTQQHVYDFKRFQDTKTFFTNQHGIQLYMTEDSTEDSDEEIDDNTEYSVTVYCKEYPTDEDCACDEAETNCVCNWNFEHNVTTQSKQFKNVLQCMVEESNSIIRCHSCEKAHLQYKDIVECTSCFVQGMMNETLPVLGQCCCCMDTIKATNKYKIPGCSHEMCTKCVKKLALPKRCPLCRQEFTFED